MSRCLLLLLLLTGAVACQHVAGPPSISEQENMLIVQQAQQQAAAANFDQAQALLLPLLQQQPPPAAAVQLHHDLQHQRRRQALEEAQRNADRELLNAVSQAQLLPATYGSTVVVTAESMEPAPPGPLERLLAQPISMHLQQAGIAELILAFSKLKGLNVIADDALKPKSMLTISVNEVPLQELLQYIARNMGVDFRIGNNVLWITAAAAGNNAPLLETNVYHLQHGFIPSLSGGIEIVATVEDNELQDALNEFFNPNVDQPRYRLYRNRNLLIARDTRTNLRRLEALLAEMDRAIRQVLIEARFITVSENDLLRVGLNMQDLIIPSGGGRVSFGDLRERITKETKNKDGSVVTEIPADMGAGLSQRRLQGSGSLPGQLFLSGILGTTTYQAVLDALQHSATSRTLSAPRVTVANNHAAVIHRGETRYYFQQYGLQSIDVGDLGTRTELVPVGNPSELKLGYRLHVKVNVGANGRTVTLALNPQVTEFIAWEQLFGDAVKMPRIAENTLKTTVVVDSGETVVLGGTLLNSQLNSVRKIPLLGDLPVIGALFRMRESSEQPLHLLIFVTATVIDSSGEFIKTVTTP